MADLWIVLYEPKPLFIRVKSICRGDPVLGVLSGLLFRSSSTWDNPILKIFMGGRYGCRHFLENIADDKKTYLVFLVLFLKMCEWIPERLAETLPHSQSVSGGAGLFVLCHHYFIACQEQYSIQYSFCFFPFLVFFFLIVERFGYQSQFLVTRKLKQLEHAVFLKSLLGEVLLYLIISVCICLVLWYSVSQ